MPWEHQRRSGGYPLFVRIEARERESATREQHDMNDRACATLGITGRVQGAGPSRSLTRTEPSHYRSARNQFDVADAFVETATKRLDRAGELAVDEHLSGPPNPTRPERLQS